jgi:hypothetical protein
MKTKRLFLQLSYHVILIIMLLFLTACANVRLVSQYDSDLPSPEVVHKTAYLWGLVQPKDVLTGEACPSICMVTVTSNFGTVLISAVTLGIVVPVRFEYFCCPDEPEPGEM